MMSVAPFKMMLICLCFISISSILLHQQALTSLSLLASSSQPELQFVDQIGPSTTEEQIVSFINFVNSASAFFKTDISSALRYIGDQMNQTYPRFGFSFSVILQANETFSHLDWSLNSQLQSIGVYASFSHGVDKIFPNNSYMFVFQTTFEDKTRVFLDSTTQKGSGIDATLENAIKNIIISLEIGSACVCSSYTSQIAEKIREFDFSSYWNVYCSQRPDLHLNVYVNQGRYIFIQPKFCYYAIYR